MDVLASLTDEFLEEHFAPETLERARGYLDRIDGPPHLQLLSAGSVTATAYVYGSAPTAYHVQLHCEVGRPSGRSRSRTAGWIFSLCTCPVRNMCKHGAAVALSMRDGHVGAERVPEWERQLGSLVEDLSRTADREVAQFPLALQFSLEEQRIYSYRDDGPLLGLRPLRPGAKQAWIKTGADWPDIPGAVVARTLLPEHADTIGALHGALQRHRGYQPAGTAPTLAQFGPHLLRLLRAAEAAGVAFVPVPPLTGVTLREKPVGLTAEITSDGSIARLTLGVDVDGELRRGERVRFIGNDRIVALLDDGHLQIAELDRDVPTVARRLIEDQPLEVPAAEIDAFRERLAGLLRHLTVRSPDGSVDVPVPVRPTLVVTVGWVSSTTAELIWEWRYDDAHRCGLDARDLLDGLRDRRTETTIRATVPSGLLGRRSVRDGDALSLAIHDLPHLRELPDIEVVEEQRPDFREATSAPVISFDVVTPAADAEADRVTDWLDLAVTVNVEGERIPLPDVIAALTLEHEFLVLPSGLFIATDRPEFDRLREVVAAAAELRERDGDRIGIGTHDLGLWAQLAETGIVDAQAAAWVARAQALRDLKEIPRPEPVGLVTDLRSYQREVFWWLAFLWEHGLGGILADDMGLGKTLQVLALIHHARERRPEDGPFLVVAPTSVVTAWAHEVERHAPGLRLGVCGRRTDDVAAIAADSDVVVTTYTVLRLAHARYAAVQWGGLVLDEAQQVKNHQSKTYAAARTVAAPFKLAVTGTPFENRLMELWALLSITVPGLYPWPRLFNERVARPVERDGDKAVLDRFRARIRPFLLRRTKELVASDLPPKQEQVLDVVLEPKHRKIYDTHLAKERQRILGLVEEDFARNRVAIFSALTKLRQLALDPALVDPAHDAVGSAKLDLLVDHLEEITAEGHRALVFSQFTSFLTRVRDRLAAEDIGATYLDGSTRDRAGVIDEFRAGGAPVFLISLKAGGVGLTLTEADYVFVLDPWWNPAAEAQAVDRAHRIGQTAHVHVYRLVATDTIEEKVMELKGRKAELFAQVIDGEGVMSTALDADDIRGLFD
ncbi:DEAD/DEAH box helicase [Nocardioides immobilis]|uniref:DEAD/DEAH box helicase n=1 Tax=Nocardioides immobilis TaxID=2049295 RepID=A0A417Y2H2_9ACTN|nr:DEAD/DEAH box helicase [Nocardioides immobilis]RHW26862.1 DEAD/DEAH box helicase [Nocardioides immobilis]